MKYSYLLVITLVISLTWGLLLFILGCIIRFQQTWLLNRYIADLESSVKTMSCELPGNPEMNICPTDGSFDSITLGSWADFLGSITIVTGFIVILLSTCGFVGVIKKSQALLLLMLVLIIVSIGFQYYIMDIALGTSGNFHESAQDELREKIHSAYMLTETDANDFTRWLNAVMLQAECCGITGPEDFSLNETIIIDGIAEKIVNPPACCEREKFNQENHQDAFIELVTCAKDGWALTAVQTGCYKLLHAYIYDNYGAMLVGFLMFLILWEGIQGILLFMIILRPAPKSPRKSLASSVGSQRSGQKAMQDTVKKKFVPFTKVSSATSDINRIKSTEIW